MAIALKTEDIAVGVYTSALNLRERALSVQNTWLKDFQNGYLLGGWYVDSELKMINLGPLVGEDYKSAHRKQFWGLLKLKETVPLAKWFYITGCDAFVMCDNLLNALDSYDYNKPCLVGGHCGIALVDNEPLLYPSGGPGFALSRGLLDLIAPSILDFAARWEERTDGLGPACDVALATLICRDFRVKLSYCQGFYNNPPYDYPDNGFYDGTCTMVHEKVIHNPIAFHGLSIREMYELMRYGNLLRPSKFLTFVDIGLKKAGRLLKTKRIVNRICSAISVIRKRKYS